MNPVSLLLGVSGLALQAYGASQKASGAAEANASQQRQVQFELQAEGVKKDFMETKARRDEMEVARNAQKARGLALNNAASQGGLFGSGLQGGLGQISGEANTNMLGIGQALMGGRQMFDITKSISGEKITQLQGQQKMSEGAGWMSMGSALTGMMGPMAQLTGTGSIGQMGTSAWNASTGGFMGSGSFNRGR
jgi:hypothetical protein